MREADRYQERTPKQLRKLREQTERLRALREQLDRVRGGQDQRRISDRIREELRDSRAKTIRSRKR